ncbi:hypothetical protein APHAL10511_008486 [Amanita phalloides]|nr:hypothetical protein APHAL10511_008486 [Amanita phalloides]
MATKIANVTSAGLAGPGAPVNVPGTVPSTTEGGREGAGHASAGGGSRGGKKGGNKGSRGGKNRGQAQKRNNDNGKGKAQPNAQEQQGSGDAEASQSLPTLVGTGAGMDAEEGGTEEPLCWICAEPVKYYSVSVCNHRTCHVCGLRLRALYKKLECTFCKEPQQAVVYTASSDKTYAEYDLAGIPHRDNKLSVYFETQEMMEDTLILLRFNCPDPECDYIGNGWGDLKLHTRAVHNRLMCDLCIRNKKVFAHEHALYPPNVLPVHLPSMHLRFRQSISKDQVEGGVHPLCEFCNECFFGDDELYTHCRERHEECFVCKRNDIRNQHFQDYNSLERHFFEAHHPCTQSECLARKFVVFGSVLDLKAHTVEEHGGDMSSRDRKDARRIVADFTFEDTGSRHGHTRRDHHEREREREPPPQSLPPPPILAGPSRQQPTGLSKRREAFGARLTVDGGPISESSAPSQVVLETNRTPTPSRDDVDPIIAERHSALIARLHSFTANPTTAVPAVKAAMRGYRSSESSARDLISTIWNILDGNLEHTASIINTFVDLLDEEEKKQDLLDSWNGFAIEQRREFPELVPTTVGGNYAAIATGRVLNAKHSTKARSSHKSSRHVWDRVAQAASSSSAHATSTSLFNQFPALERSQTPQTTSSSLGPAIRPSLHQKTTSWTSFNTTSVTTAATTPRPVETKVQVVAAPTRPSAGPPKLPQRPPKLSAAQFPGLPSSSAGRHKPPVGGNPSLKNILGATSGPAVAAWQAGPSGSVNAISSSAGDVGEVEGDVGEAFAQPGAAMQAKGKKGKGRQKQTLFTLGSFPS